MADTQPLATAMMLMRMGLAWQAEGVASYSAEHVDGADEPAGQYLPCGHGSSSVGCGQ